MGYGVLGILPVGNTHCPGPGSRGDGRWLLGLCVRDRNGQGVWGVGYLARLDAEDGDDDVRDARVRRVEALAAHELHHVRRHRRWPCRRRRLRQGPAPSRRRARL